MVAAERTGLRADEPGAQPDRGQRVRELLEQQEQRAVRHQQRVADDRRQHPLDRREDLRVGRREHEQHRGKRRGDRLGDDERRR